MGQVLVVLTLVAITSGVAYLVGVKELGLRKAAFQAAVGETFECIGLVLAFFFLNLSLGIVVTVLVRALGWGFVSFYLLDDVILLLLSLFQALVFQQWCKPAGRS